MANITKQKRDEMLAFLEQLKADHNDDASIRAFNEIQNHLTEKKFGLVFEEHTEEVDEKLLTHIPVLCADKDRRLCKDESKPWNFIIQGDNLQALYLLEKTHRGKVDCIYIDPPYNTGARDWKYNNDYVEKTDNFRHSKWLSMMQNRLRIARKLLNPNDSILMIAIDDNELCTLKMMLEELFPDCEMQILDIVINPKGKARIGRLSQVDEYIIIVYIGNAKTISDKSLEEGEEIRWPYLRRSDVESARGTTKGGVQQFYPIYVDKDTQKIVKIGKALAPEQPLSDAEAVENAVAVFPIREDGKHMNWGLTGESLQYALDNHCVRVTKSSNAYQAYNFAYVTLPSIKKVLEGTYHVVGERADGTKIIILPDGKEHQKPTVWKKNSYDANAYGTKLISKFLIDKRFSFPKSVYAVYDTLKIYLEDKKNAIVLDFFAGSGTTLHAINLLNAEDGGNRRCIIVTNNEVSDKEEQALTAKGLKKGDDEWEALGIARYVTWPRTKCSIEGTDIKGNVLEGDYGVEAEDYVLDEDAVMVSKKTGKEKKGKIYKKAKIQLYPTLSNIKLSDGFVANVKYFKCDWTPRKPEDYLLSNALCLHIREMIELQNHIEIDNKKYVLILNKSDFNKYVMNPEFYEQIEQIWVNQSIVLNSEELKTLRAKGFKYIPREFFGQELREAAE